METDANTLLAIAGMALATYATRIGGFALMRFMQVRGRMKAALDAMPAAILMSVIAPTVIGTGAAETLAAVITAGVAILRLPMLVVIIIGIASVVALRSVL
jgi:uncharacterized membrane protein